MSKVNLINNLLSMNQIGEFKLCLYSFPTAATSLNLYRYDLVRIVGLGWWCLLLSLIPWWLDNLCINLIAGLQYLGFEPKVFRREIVWNLCILLLENAARDRKSVGKKWVLYRVLFCFKNNLLHLAEKLEWHM